METKNSVTSTKPDDEEQNDDNELNAKSSNKSDDQDNNDEQKINNKSPILATQLSESPSIDTSTASLIETTEIEQQNGQFIDNLNDSNDIMPNIGYNPPLTDDLKEHIEKIKGDAIGDTLFSSRFVLKTLLKLTKYDCGGNANSTQPVVDSLNDTITTLSSNSNSEMPPPNLDKEFEKDLCTLWDMTIEQDVVNLLLDHNVLELFSTIIQVTEDQRLTEILVGIIGNMCAVSKTRDTLCGNENVMRTILDLISCSDPLVLIQLMRLLQATLVFENSGDEITWLQHFKSSDDFVKDFSFLLSNSMKDTLLLHAYEALNAMCTVFSIAEMQPIDQNNASGDGDDECSTTVTMTNSFRDTFVKTELIAGVIEAFKQMVPTPAPGETIDERSLPTQRSQRIMNLFLDINVTLSHYGEWSLACYQPHMTRMFQCISRILKPLCKPIHLFPFDARDSSFLENINELIQSLGDQFHDQCFTQMIHIWSLLDASQLKKQLKVINKAERGGRRGGTGCGSGTGGGGGGGDWDTDEPESNEEEDETEEEEDSAYTDDAIMTILEFLTRTSKSANVEIISQAIKNSTLNGDTIQRIYFTLLDGDSLPDIKECCEKFKLAAASIWNLEIINNHETHKSKILSPESSSTSSSPKQQDPEGEKEKEIIT